ncbi:SwmB domain-containing protein [Polaribacter sp. PL03]|uniref:SwmB domain-containing protein n=1 Tax=Polaribacter sp. PL03 TaxID=3088353 RepID=UPI0029D0325B|nr:SwmB domain-containing protein [Polaribacter sp. PL03]MDX6747935.1 SwmB domain-containing protein [Polaribacter sp. PL03]
MKKYSILLIVCLLALVNCKTDDFEPLSEFSKVELFTPSIFDLNETTIANSIPISINDFSSLTDVSQGVLSRVWTIEDGARFLKPTFKRKDSVNLVPFIDGTLGKESTVETAHVLFQKAGETSVSLKNNFNEEVSFLGKKAVLNEGVWEIITVFNFDVYGDLEAATSVSNEANTAILGSLEANQNPNKDETSSFKTITIEAGSSLTYKDLSTIGRPDGRVWAFEGGIPETSEEEELSVSYNRLGEYKVSITATRTKRGNSLNAAEQTKTMPIIVKVIPSTKPFVIVGEGKSKDDNTAAEGTNTFSFTVNGELESFTGAESSFTVNVVNGSVFNQNFTVTSAKVNSSNATQVDLILSEPILNSDTVSVSYNGNIIKSVDSRALVVFSNINVEALNLNLLTNASNPGFENASTNDRQVNSQGYNLFVGGGNSLDNARNTDGSLMINRSTEMASTGSASLKFDAEMPLAAGFLSLSNTIASNSGIPAGDYKLAFDVYLEKDTEFKALFTVVQGGNPQGAGTPFNAPGTEQWFQVQRNFSLNSNLTRNVILNFRNNDNIGVTGRQVFYIDNIQIISREER